MANATETAINLNAHYFEVLAEARTRNLVFGPKNPNKRDLFEFVAQYNADLEAAQGKKPVAKLKPGSLAAQMAAYLQEHGTLRVNDYRLVGLEHSKYVRRIIGYLREKGFEIRSSKGAYSLVAA